MFSNSGSTFGSGNAFSTNNNTNAGGSLFGTNASATPNSDSTNNTQSFGMFGNNQPNTSTGGLFGNKVNTASTNQSPGLFGNTSSQSNSASGGLFGNNNNSQTTSSPGGLFGNNNTNQTSSPAGGLFGSLNTNTNTNTNTTSGLFGNSNTSNALNGGLLGGNTQTSSSGLFGNNATQNKPTGGLFGNATSSSNSNAGSSLFGNNQNTGTGGLFGSSNASTAKPSLFGNTSATPNQGGLFGNSQTSNMSNINSAAGTPFKQYNVKDLPKSLTDSTKTKRTVNHTAGTRQRSFSSANTPPAPILNARSSLLERFSTRLNTLKSDEFSAEGLFSPKKDLIQSALAPEKIVASPKTNKRSFRSLGSSFTSSNRRGISSTAASDFLKLEVDPSRTEARRLKIFGESGGAKKIRVLGRETEPALLFNDASDSKSEDVDVHDEQKDQSNGVNQPESNNIEHLPETQQEETPAARPTTEDNGYWCSPSIQELSSLSLRQLSEIPDFTIGRKGYGSIHFELPVDLTAFWSDLPGYLFGNIVRFNKNKTVEVYPNGSVPLGTGLNVPATITLEKVFPISKIGKKKLDKLAAYDTELRIFVKKLKELNDMEFVAYDPINGSWTFKVEHFSVWGLVDEDVVVVDADEESENPTETAPVKSNIPLSNPEQEKKADVAKPLISQSKIPSKRIKPRNSDEDTFVFRKRRQEKPSKADVSFSMPGSFIIDDDDDEDGSGSFELLRSENNILEKDEDLLTDNGRLNLVSEHGSRPFDDSDDGSLIDESEDELAGYKEKQFEPIDVNEKDFAYLENEPNLEIAEDWDQQLELSSKSNSAFAELNSNTKYSSSIDGLVSNYLSKIENHSAPKTKPDLKVDHYKSITFSNEKGLIINDPSSEIEGTKKPLNVFDNQDKSFIRAVCKEHIRQSKIVQRKNGFPLVSPNPKLSFKFITSAFESHPEFKVASVWRLASVIFDSQDLSDETNEIQKQDVYDRILDIKHREGLSAWIQSEISEEIDDLVVKSTDSFEKIFLSLVLGDIADASKLAFKSNNPHLSVLLTLLGSNDPEVKFSAGKQIEYWTKNSILPTIPISLLKIYYLLKGDPLFSDSYFSVTENLSWKAKLSLYLSHGDLNESLSTLLTTFVEAQASSDIVDEELTQFALLKLFVSQQSEKYDIKEIFSSLNDDKKFGASLQWYLYEILIRSTRQLSLGHESSAVGDKLTLAYAEELFANELYEEGIFVLSHLHDNEQANLSISRLVAVNIEKFSNIGGLLDDLSSVLKVPTKLIIESKALFYRFNGDIWKESSYLLDAENYEEAHKAIINKVAPAAVINNGSKLKQLEQYISRFPEQHTIKDWNTGLLVYKNYIQSVKVKNESSLRYLVEHLPHVKQENFKIKVAVRLMSKKVAMSLIESSRSDGQSFMELDKRKVLNLPLGEDAPYFAKDFAIEYFKQILTGV